VRQLTDSSGEVTYARTYNPYGEVTSTAGTAQTSYGYTGEYFGDYNELVYLRARNYAPGIGRFITRDTWNGEIKSPITYNKWAYANANPIVYIDQTGLSGSFSLASFQIPFQSHLPGHGLEDTSWTENEKSLINTALWNIASAYARAYNFYHPEMDCLVANGIPPEVAYKLLGMQYKRIDPIVAFLRIHQGKVTFYKHSHQRINPDTGKEDDTWGMGINYKTVNIFSVGAYTVQRYGKGNESIASGNYIRFITHEMGHVFDHAVLKATGVRPGKSVVPSDLVVGSRLKDSGFCGAKSTRDEGWQWRFEDKNFEYFADMYVGWVYMCWEKDFSRPSHLSELGEKRSNFMDDIMPKLIYDIIGD